MLFNNSRFGIDWAKVVEERQKQAQQRTDAATTTAQAAKTNADVNRGLLPSTSSLNTANAGLATARATEIPLEGQSVRNYRGQQTRELNINNDVLSSPPSLARVMGTIGQYGFQFSDDTRRSASGLPTMSLADRAEEDVPFDQYWLFQALRGLR